MASKNMRKADIYILATTYSVIIAKSEEYKTLKEGDSIAFGGISYFIHKINNDSVEFDAGPSHDASYGVKSFTQKIGEGKYFDDNPNIICGYSHWLMIVNDIESDMDQTVEMIKEFEQHLKSLPDKEQKILYSHYFFGVVIPSLATDKKERAYYDARNKVWRAAKVDDILRSALEKLEQKGYWPAKTIRYISYLPKFYLQEIDKEFEKEESKPIK